MKVQKRLSVLTILITITSVSFSQTYGVKVGIGLTNINIKESEAFIPYDYSDYENSIFNLGYYFGGSIEIPLINLFTIESGLGISNRSLRTSKEEILGSTTLENKDMYNLFFLDIPLQIKIPFSLGSQNLFASIGSYASMGLLGNIKSESIFGDLIETENETVSWGSNPAVDNFRRLDYGVSVGAGIKLYSFKIGLSYDLGLANMSPGFESGSQIGNSALKLSVTYTFGDSKSISKEKVTEPEETILKQPKVKEPRQKEIRTSKNDSNKRKKNNAVKDLKQEQVRADSIANDVAKAKLEAEQVRIIKARNDSIELAAQAEKARLEKIRADSIILAAQKAAELEAANNAVVYRVQFASTTTQKGSYKVRIDNKEHTTWEYFYKGAYRSTVGKLKTLREATAFQKLVRQSGFGQGFVVAFKGGERSTDPSLFK